MSNVNLDFIERNQPSLFIHFAYPNVTEEMVSRTLDELDLGSIREISFKPATNKKDEHGNSIAVHFDRWLINPTADKVRQKLISGMSVNINYNPKSYWKVIAFQQKSKPEIQPRTLKKPTITFDDEDELDFGPKLGTNCAEKNHTAKVRCDERPRHDERPRRDEHPRQVIPRQERPKRDEHPRQVMTRQERPRDEMPIQEMPKQKLTKQLMIKQEITKQERPQRERVATNEIEETFQQKPRATIPPHQPVVYKNYLIKSDVFDMNGSIANKGVLLPPPKRKVNILVDSPSDSDSEDEKDEKDEEIELLYSDFK